MNPNDLSAEYQALLNQAMQQQHDVQSIYWVIGIVNLVALLIGAWAAYMFYARIAEMARELQKLRIAYEFSTARVDQSASTSPRNDESRYMPKR